jgi:hypothetical protein
MIDFIFGNAELIGSVAYGAMTAFFTLLLPHGVYYTLKQNNVIRRKNATGDVIAFGICLCASAACWGRISAMIWKCVILVTLIFFSGISLLDARDAPKNPDRLDKRWPLEFIVFVPCALGSVATFMWMVL